MADAPLLELRGITKRFPGVLANDNVDFDLRRGEVHALLGENGAGKSTLMNILYGLYTPDEGQILLEGRPIELGSTKAAIEHGIGMVHQHFMLIPVMSVAENITTLRRGVVVGTVPAAGATEEGLARMMVGREVLLRVDKKPPQPGAPLLQVENLSVVDDRGLEAVRDVSFEVRGGEIVGIAGVDANGQSELIDAIAGLRHVKSGRVVVDGEDITHAHAKDALDAGIGHIPEDRHRRGLVLPFTLAENLALSSYRRPPNSRWALLNLRVIFS